jgi:hypothetical protein
VVSNRNPGEVNDSGDQEHLTHQLNIPDDLEDKLRAMATANAAGETDAQEDAEREEDNARIMGLVQALGLVSRDEIITPEEARRRLAANQAEQAEQARAAIAGAGDPESHTAEAAAQTQERPARDEKGRRLYKSKFDPDRMVARLRPGDREEIDQLLKWYSDLIDHPDLTAEQALGLIIDARSQGLYRRDKDTGERTILVRDEQQRSRVADLFGEGTEDLGRAEERLQELRTAERAVRASGQVEHSGGKLEELQGLVGAFEERISDLKESDSATREDWKQILDDFIYEGLFEYGDRGLVSTTQNRELREKAWALLNEARREHNHDRTRTAPRKKIATDAAEPSSEPAASEPTQASAEGWERTLVPLVSGKSQLRPRPKGNSGDPRVQAWEVENAYDSDDYAEGLMVDEAGRDEFRDPDGLIREAAGGRGRLIRRLFDRYYPKPKIRQVEPPITAEQEPPQAGDISEQVQGEYNPDLEKQMAQAYRRDPVAWAVEKVRRQEQKEIDKEPDEQKREIMRGRQRDLMQNERRKMEKILENERRAKEGRRPRW